MSLKKKMEDGYEEDRDRRCRYGSEDRCRRIELVETGRIISETEEIGDCLSANKKIPMRQCVGCREMKNKERDDPGDHVLLKQEFVLDATGKKNGTRSAYLCRTRECLVTGNKEQRTGAFF